MSEQDVQPANQDTAVAPEATADAVTTVPENDTPAPAPEPSTPDWFMKDKYKSVEEQARAQYEMSKMIGTNWGPPKDNYKLDGIEGINPNDPVMAQMLPTLKEIGLSQTAFNTLIKSYQAAQIEGVKKMESDLRETLTQEDAVAIRDVDDWLDNNFPKETADGLRSMITTKEDFYHLRSLKALIPPQTNVPSANANVTPMETVAQVDQEKIKYLNEVKQGLRVEDKNHWDALNARFRDAYTRENMHKR